MLENDKNWNAYFYEGTDVLKNKLGITSYQELKEKEIEVTFERLLELQVNPIEMDFDENHLRAIHFYLFQDIYPFAGEYRTVYMEKNNSYFAAVNDIPIRLKDTLTQMKEEEKYITSRYSFASHLASYYVELLQIHPFREGNGRTIREFIREYANEKSKKLSFGEVEFSWNLVDQKALQENIDKAVAFHSSIELEFQKALQSKNINKQK